MSYDRRVEGKVGRRGELYCIFILGPWTRRVGRTKTAMGGRFYEVSEVEKRSGWRGEGGEVNLVVVLLNLLLLFLLLNISLLGQGIDNLDVGGLPGSEIGSGINNGSLIIS